MKPQGRALIAVGVFGVLLLAMLATRDRGNVTVGVARLELPVVDSTQVTSIEVTGAQTVTLKKGVNGWTVADASKAFHPADEAQLNDLLSQLKDLKAGDFVTERAEKLTELELDGSKGLTVKVFTTSPTPALEVVFGKAAKSGGSYLRSPKSNQTFVTHSGVAWGARRDANGWRKRAFFPTTADQLSAVEIKREDGATHALSKNPDGKWALTTPVPAGFRFDPSAADRFVDALARATAVDFLDATGVDPFAAPHATVVAQRKDGAPVVLHLGAALPAATDGGVPRLAGVTARIDADPQLYLVGADAAAALKQGLAGLRDTTLLAFDPSKAKRLAITSGGKKTVVSKEGTEWKLVEPKTAPTGFTFEPTQVLAQLQALQSLRAKEVAENVTDAEAGIPKATTRVEISLEGGPPQTLAFGGETSDHQRYVKGSADSLVYLVDPSSRARWEQGLELFKKPAPPPNANQMRGLDDLPPELRRQLEAQLRQRGQ